MWRLFPLLLGSLVGQIAAGAPSLSGSNVPEAYASWLFQHGDRYSSQDFVGINDELAVQWRVEDDTIYLAVAVGAKGWLGFGLSEVGGMKGADMFIFSAADATIKDMYSLDYSFPDEDTCQDWKLESSTVDPAAGFMIVEVSRKLQTGDLQDLDFYDDTDLSLPSHRVIAAWGDMAPQFHGNNVGAKLVRFFGGHNAKNTTSVDVVEKALEKMEDDDSFYIDLRASNYTIPTNMTTYADFCFFSSDLEALGLDLSQSPQMISAEYLEGGNNEFVHHITLNGANEDEDCERAFQSIWIWGPGSETSTMPENVGIPFGLKSYKTLRMEIHYNNQDQIPDMINDAGVRLQFTYKQREHNAGPLTIGDPLLGLFGQPIGEGWSEWEFNCPGSCTESYIKNDIYVFRSVLHMHEMGARMVMKQFRDGVEINDDHVDYYDFQMAGAYDVRQQPFVVKPGDSFQVKCYYDNDDIGGNRTFGIASYQEMCMAFLWYYPKESAVSFCGPGIGQFVPGCEGDFKYTETDEAAIGRSFGTSDGVCGVKEGVNTTEGLGASAGSFTFRLPSGMELFAMAIAVFVLL